MWRTTVGGRYGIGVRALDDRWPWGNRLPDKTRAHGSAQTPFFVQVPNVALTCQKQQLPRIVAQNAAALRGEGHHRQGMCQIPAAHCAPAAQRTRHPCGSSRRHRGQMGRYAALARRRSAVRAASARRAMARHEAPRAAGAALRVRRAPREMSGGKTLLNTFKYELYISAHKI